MSHIKFIFFLSIDSKEVESKKLAVLNNCKEVSTALQMKNFALLNDSLTVSVPSSPTKELHLFSDDSEEMSTAPTQEKKMYVFIFYS